MEGARRTRKEKRNKGKKDEPENPNQALEWKYLPKELLIKMVVERTSHEDCNAGVIFDNLTSPFWKDEKQLLMLFVMHYPKKMCT